MRQQIVFIWGNLRQVGKRLNVAAIEVKLDAFNSLSVLECVTRLLGLVSFIQKSLTKQLSGKTIYSIYKIQSTRS